MIDKRGIYALIVVIALVSIATYTWDSYVNEPHPQNPIATTERAYSAEVAMKDNGTLSSLFYHTFSSGGSNATYGFSFHSQSPDIYISQELSILRGFI